MAACLQALTTTVLLIQEARKLTMGQKSNCLCASCSDGSVGTAQTPLAIP